MDFELYFKMRWIAFWLLVPFSLVILKFILQYLFSFLYDFFVKRFKRTLNKMTIKYGADYIDSYGYEQIISELGPKANISEQEIKHDVNRLIRLDKALQVFSTLDDIFDSDNIKFLDSLWYSIFCVVGFIAMIIGFCFWFSIHCDFSSQQKLYESNYQIIKMFDNYQSLPNWESNARMLCLKAEDVNSKYFEIDGSLNSNEFYLISDESKNSLKPVNTNVMWKDFLSKVNKNDAILDIVR